MTQKPKPGRRIVSRGEYAVRVGKRIGTGFWGCGLLLMAVFFGLFSAGMACASVQAIIDIYFHHSNGLALDRLTPLVTCVFFLMITKFLWKRGNANVELSTQKMYVIPLTRVNTADLPAPEILVRASSEPPQAQESMLLRAAAEGQETPPEQLVRAFVGQEQI